MSTIHIPVLIDEVLESLAVQPGQIVVDGTLGGGGHARRLAEAVSPQGLVVGIDRDPAAVESARSQFAEMPVRLIRGSYAELPQILTDLEIPAVDGVLLDLGLSSDQLADGSRGFSFDSDGPLDLRFDPDQGVPAWQLLDRWNAEQIADVLYEYGEERLSRRIARRIVETRRSAPIRTAEQLAALVRSCVPRSPGHRIDPATRTFQALRIAVNGELEQLERALRRVPDCLRIGGRLAIISFHSLEDRRVKLAFKADARLEVLTKKPIQASPHEAHRNPRSRSAKLRVAVRMT
jgi:16S rRNA (cytosine1402-N4)-methyltransferase